MAKWAATKVAYEEYGQRRERWDIQNPQCSVTVRVAAEDVQQFIREMFGTEWPGNPVTPNNFNEPFTLLFPLIAWTFDVEQAPQKYGTDIDEEQMDFTGNDSLVTINYQLPPEATRGGASKKKQDPDTMDLVTISERFEFVEVIYNADYKSLRWKTETGPIGEAINEPLSPRELQFTHETQAILVRDYDGIFFAFSDWIELLNTVNDAAYTSTLIKRKSDGANFTFPAGSLLFNRGSVGRVYAATTDSQELRYTINLQWSYKPSGWNKFFRPRIIDVGPITGIPYYDTIQYLNKDAQTWIDYVPYPEEDHSNWLY